MQCKLLINNHVLRMYVTLVIRDAKPLKFVAMPSSCKGWLANTQTHTPLQEER
jgi:hypothetical protein